MFEKLKLMKLSCINVTKQMPFKTLFPIIISDSSEGNIEGNPRQTGKTKMTFSIQGDDQKVLKKLAKMVNTDQSVNGLSVYAGSLEYDE